MLPGMFTVAVTFIFASLSYTLSIFFGRRLHSALGAEQFY
jgi:hypothetical protein